MTLTKYETHFIIHWGEMGGRWGVNRTVAQIHALLFIRAKAMAADEICQLLNIARSNVSNSIKELEILGLIKRTHLLGDRRDHFETYGDVWELFRIIARTRLEKELVPTQQLLTQLMNEPDFKKEAPEFQERTKATIDLLDTMTRWGDEMLKLSTGTMKSVLKVGSGLQKFIRGKGNKE